MTTSAMMTDPAQIREFVFAGDARLTLVSKRTGARYTYRVRKPARYEPSTSRSPTHFVGVLAGSDNEASYAYLGMYRGDDAPFEHGRKSRVAEGAPSVVAWRWFDAKVLRGGAVPADLEVFHEGRCGRCGRALTVPKSIAVGLGSICRAGSC